MRRGICAVISRKIESGEKEYLLVSSKKDRGEHTGKFYPPSGWAENGESEEETLVRELMEELKLEIRVLKKIAAIPGDIPDLTLHFWECEIIGKEEIELKEDELAGAGWFSVGEMKNMNLYPATVRLFREHLHEDI